MSLPTVTTQAVSAILPTIALANGDIDATGNGYCSKQGFVYDLASHADPGNVAPSASGYGNYAEDRGTFDTGSFDIELSGLAKNTKYYVRAYAYNASGYSYGNEVDFTTLENIYPDAIYSPRVKSNKAGVNYDSSKATTLYAPDVSQDDDEIVAIETELGLNPKGEYPSLIDRILAGDVSEAVRYKAGRRGFKTDFQSTDFAQIFKSAAAGRAAGEQSLDIYTGNTINNYNRYFYGIEQEGLGYRPDKNPRVAFLMKAGQATAQEIFLILGEGSEQSAFGFKIVNGQIYAWSHYWDVDEVDHIYIEAVAGTVTDLNLFEAVYTYQTDIKYYINGVLVHTQTTDLPENDPYFITRSEYFQIWLKTTAAANKSICVYFAEFYQDV